MRRLKSPTRSAAILALLAGALTAFAPGVTRAAAPVDLVYDAFAAGFPAVTLNFRIDSTDKSYRIAGELHTNGLADLIMHYRMTTESDGTVGVDGLAPAGHQSRSKTIRGERSARLDFKGASVSATANPPGDTELTPADLEGTIDPLTAILTAGRSFAATGRCDQRIKVFDGRRRYDLVLTDEGDDVLQAGLGIYNGTARRCNLDMVKLNDDPNRPRPHTTQVWLAQPWPDAPPLPVRIDFQSSWGPATVRIVAIKPGTAAPAAAQAR